MNGSDLLIKDVKKSFGDTVVLNNINLEIKKGEFFSLLGPSGCGKTTLLRIIGGFESPDSGSVLLDNQDVVPMTPDRRPTNTIFQSYALFPHLTVYENVAFPLRLKKMPENKISEIVKRYLSLVRLESHINKKTTMLSGGQKQRVAIARALVNEPKVLLLDEPLSALDAKLRQHMLIELDSIHDQIGITFIFVTHDQQEALSVSDRVAVMHQGNILQVGTPSQIYESPADMFVADFIGETNFLQGEVLSVNGDTGVMKTENAGNISFFLDKPVKVGDKVKVTVRPEKIHISKNKPEGSEKINVLFGEVDKLIYTGFQTKYFVNTEKSFLFKVFKQHIKYFMDEPVIDWYDKVFISWNSNDSYLVEAES